MSDPCNCHEETLEKIRAKLIGEGRIPEGAAEIDFRWKDRAFILSGGDHSPVAPQLELSYRQPKKGGGFRENKTTKQMGVFGDYCTFCGRKYGEVKSDGWIATADRLPEKPGKKDYEQIDCFVFLKGQIKRLVWNCEHQVWDDSSGDDYYCDALEPTHWMEDKSWPSVPITPSEPAAPLV